MNPSLAQTAHARNDSEVLDRVRAGDLESFAELYERYRPAALRVATSLAGPSRAEDLVADAFTKILQLLLAGRGPDYAFGAYLNTTVRNVGNDRFRKERRELLVDDVGEHDQTDPVDPWHTYLEDRMVAAAIASLPERWQQVLRLATIEQRPLDEVAAIMGTNSNAVAQLAYRAREALRLAYLAQHVREPATEACERVIPLLARHARGNAGSRGSKVEAHLSTCSSCSSAGVEIDKVGATIR